MADIKIPIIKLDIIDQHGNYCGVHRVSLNRVLIVEAHNEDGEVWMPPTAFAYFAVCRERNAWRARYEELVNKVADLSAKASPVISTWPNTIDKSDV